MFWKDLVYLLWKPNPHICFHWLIQDTDIKDASYGLGWGMELPGPWKQMVSPKTMAQPRIYKTLSNYEDWENRAIQHLKHRFLKTHE